MRKYNTIARTVPQRVDFIGNRDDQLLLTYVGMGYTSKFIESRTGLTRCQISYRSMKLNRLGISRSAYRNGLGVVASIVEREAVKKIEAALVRHLQAHL